MRIEQSTFRYVEGILHSFEKYPRMISNRRLEITNPYTETDGNIGGGSGNRISNETERMASRLISDKKLMGLTSRYNAMKETLARADDKTRQIIEIYYIKKPRLVTWEGVAEQVDYSSRQCRRIRDKFIQDLAEELGLE